MNYRLKITDVPHRNEESGGFDYPIIEDFAAEYKYDTDTCDEIGDYLYGYPIQLEKLQNIISNLRTSGANYISLDYHEDHGSVLIQGLKISLSTVSDVEKEKNTLLEELSTQEMKTVKKKIEWELEERRLERIKKELNKYE